MLGPTHRALAVTAATGVSVACSAPLSAAAVIVLAAWTTARLPDRIERIWFWMNRRILRFGPHWRRHRENWTHWPTSCALIGAALGAAVYALGLGTAAGLTDLIESDHGGLDREARQLVGIAIQGGAIFGVLVGIGATLGSVQHPLADACTKGGAPLGAPFTRRLMWLMPRGWRVSVGEPLYNPDGTRARDEQGRALRSREMTDGEKRWLRGAWLVTGMLVASQFLPELIGFWQEVLEAIDAAQPR